HETFIIDANTWKQVSNAVLEPLKVTEFGPSVFDKITFLPKQQILVGYGLSNPALFYNIRTGQLLRAIETDVNSPVVIPSANTNEIILSDVYDPKGARSLLLYNTDDFLQKKTVKAVPVAKYPAAWGGYFDGARQKAWFSSKKEVNEYNTDTKTTTHILKGIIADWGWFESKSFGYDASVGRMNINADRLNIKTIDLFRMVAIRHSRLDIDPVAVAVSATGDTVAEFDYKTVIIKNVKTGKFIRQLTTIGSVDFTDAKCIFFSSDAKYLYYPIDGENKKLMCRMNVATGIKQVLFTVRGFGYILVTKDKRLMLGNDETYQYRMVTVWNLVTGAKLFTKDMTADKAPLVFLSADEKKFKITGDNLYWIYDLATLKPIVSAQSIDVKADFEEATGIMYSPDKKVYYKLMPDNTLKVWEVATGRYIGILYLLRDSNDFVFMDEDGRFDGSPDGIKSLYFIVNLQPVPLDRYFEKYYTPNLYQRLLNNETLAPLPNGTINPTPKVKISYAQTVRNLNVVDDKIPAYLNTTGVAEITVNASAENDKIDEIRLFHNGKIVNLATRGLFVTDNTTGTDTKKYTLNLLPGVNNIRAVALNGQRTESEPDEIIVTYNSGGQTNIPAPVNKSGAIVDAVDRNATMHLVVVGINAYKNPKMSLNYALADATAFKDAAELDAKSIITTVKTYFVTDDRADKSGIIAALAEVQKNAKPQDVFVFYYAGHGVISEKNKEFYLVPNDVTDLKNVDEALQEHGIPSKMLQRYAIDIAAQKQVFILDACQSAGAFATLLRNDGDQQKSLATVARSTGTHWIAASGSQQFANEFSQL
ncbi:MAG: caspase family protein, partial [Mucilaginibacter sp.]